MLETISWFIIAFATYVVDCYVFNKIIGEGKFKLDLKKIGLIALASIIYCYFKSTYSAEICIIVTNVELAILLKILYDKSIVKTLIAVLAIFICYAISEVAFALGIRIIGIDIGILDTSIGLFIGNITILLLVLVIISQKVIANFIRIIMNWYKEIEVVNTIVLVLIAIITFCAVMYPIAKEENSCQEIITYLLFFICMAVFVSGFFRQKTRNNKLSTEYDYLLEYAKVYEKELNEKSKRQHEYRNQLVLLKEMANSKKASEYISKLLDEEEIEVNTKLLNQLKNLPDGGLKGLIYYKISHIEDKSTEVHINIGHELEDERIWESCSDELHDVSKIVGIFLDNAIEALANEKEKYLIIDVDYIGEEIVFTFSNTCTKKPDFEKLEKEGYTTKGGSHGYGLPVVRDIVKANPLLRATTEINGRFFVKKLYIEKK